MNPFSREPGAKEFGKYRLHRLLARGGMGEVYLARLVGELGFEKELVVKTILPEHAAKARFIELFAAEAKTAVALSHGNIVPIYELGRAGDTFYIVMGYVDGPSVADLLAGWRRNDRPPTIAIALHILRGVLTGLAYAHRDEPGRPAVVHRDISPRNVLIDRSGQVRIVDFGIAAPAKTRVDLRAGSTGYMAPEQARGEAADPRADVFSTACLAYVLLTGERAFPTEGVWATPDLARVPEDLRDALGEALAFDPEARPADAGEFLRRLRPALARHTATFGDPELASHLSELFPRGWDLETEPVAAGHAELDEGLNLTFATRLTAITNVPAHPPEVPEGSDRGSVAAPADAPPVRPPSHWQRSAISTTVGAVAIGAFAFGLGRFFADDVPPLATLHPAELAAATEPVHAATTMPGSQRPRSPGSEDATRLGSPARPVTAEATLSVPAAMRTTTPDAMPVIHDTPSTVPTELLATPTVLDAKLATTEEIVPTSHAPKLATTEATGSSSERNGVAQPEGRHEAPASSRKREREGMRESGFVRVVAPSVEWAEVKIDGRTFGHTPTRALKLAPGRHRVEVRCIPDACPTPTPMLQKTVTIAPGETLTVEAR